MEIEGTVPKIKKQYLTVFQLFCDYKNVVKVMLATLLKTLPDQEDLLYRYFPPKRMSLQLIMLYFPTFRRSCPSLWKVKSKDYSNRNLRNEAYEKLINKLREIEPTADRDMVIRKINSLRSAFRRELKKVKGEHSGMSSEQLYEPRLWYFDLLYFTVDQETARRGKSSMDSDNEDNETEEVEHIEDQESTANDTNEESQLSLDSSTQDSITNQIQSKNKGCLKRKNMEQEEKTNKNRLLSLACETLTQNKSNDRCEIFGKNVAIKLKAMSHEQQLLTEKMVSEVLFYGELGHLTLYAAQMLPSILSPDSQLPSRTPSSLSSSSTVYNNYPQQSSPDIGPIYTQLHTRNYTTDM